MSSQDWYKLQRLQKTVDVLDLFIYFFFTKKSHTYESDSFYFEMADFNGKQGR